jgi:hypothetical protein
MPFEPNRALSGESSAAEANSDTPANPGSASKTTKLFSKIKMYLTDMHPTSVSVHLLGGCLMGVYLTGASLIGVSLYLTGAHIMDVYLTGVHVMGIHFIYESSERA